MAMISADNAVELAIQTYLGLPARSRGGPGPTRRELDEARGRLPALLGLLEQYAREKIEGIELGDIEYYHRLRNVLYHEGNGIAVEADKVEAYLEIVRIVFLNLFGIDVRGEVLPEPESDRAQLLARWADLVGASRQQLVAESPAQYGSFDPYYQMLRSATSDPDFEALRRLRNSAAHGASMDVVRKAIEQVERAEEKATESTGTVTCTPRQPLPPGCAAYVNVRESRSTKHANPPLTEITVEVGRGHHWRAIALDELVRRFGQSGYRGKYVLAFVPGGTESEVRQRGIELNKGTGTSTWGVRYMYNALGCWGYPITYVGGRYRLWAVSGDGILVGSV